MSGSISLSPVFIVGTGRSGTTLLRLMMNRHRVLRVPSESWFIRDLVDYLPIEGPLRPDELVVACNLIAGNTRWKDWGCSEETLRGVVQTMVSPTLAEVIDAVFRHCCGMGGKPLWGDKTPHYCYCVRQLHTLFPKARFIHIVRDGRDVCTSMVKLGWYGGSIRRIARRWTCTIESAREVAEFAPQSYHEVRFESLVTDPEGTLREICAFLGLPFDRAMLEHEKTAATDMPEWERSIHSKEFNPPDIAEIGRWRSELLPWQVFVFESLAKRTMKRLEIEPRFKGPAYRLAKRVIRAWGAADQRIEEFRLAIPSLADLAFWKMA